MQYTTRFSQVEDVILTDGNFISEYKEIQLGLKVYFSSMKLMINKRCQLNTRELKCISFDDISRSNKDRLKRQIFPVGRLENSDRALVKIYRGNLNSHLIIQEIKENSFTFYSTLNTNEIPMDWEKEFCDIGTFNFKYSEYEIIYCIVKELAQNRLFEDIEEFEVDYNFYKKMFIGTEKEFLKCLIHPYKLDGYSAIPYDYRDIENYSDLQTHLLKIKNGLVTPPATEQPTNKKPIKDKPVISFKAMFKYPSDYDKVLGYVGEYLTDTNQWTGTIIYLSAFYGVLKDRGYLNKIYKAPQINSTLKNEFGIEPTTTDKNFQDAEINYAVGLYAEAFNMIPSLKFTK